MVAHAGARTMETGLSPYGLGRSLSYSHAGAVLPDEYRGGGGDCDSESDDPRRARAEVFRYADGDHCGLGTVFYGRVRAVVRAAAVADPEVAQTARTGASGFGSTARNCMKWRRSNGSSNS